MPTPPAEIAIDEALIESLLTAQHPDLAHLRVSIVANGWDNVMARLGSDLAVRLPRRAAAAELVVHEQQWLPKLAALVGDAVRLPVPVRVGAPEREYPWAWSVVPWLPGTTIGADGTDDVRVAEALAAFLTRIHVPALPSAPVNRVRGGRLDDRAAVVGARIDSGAVPEPGAVRTLWERFAAVPGWEGRPVWVHGDLHPDNIVLGADGVIAVVDFGDVTAGDPATDLATAWLTFLPEARARFTDRIVADEATWLRAAGWALCIGSALCTADEERLQCSGQRAIAAVVNAFA